MSRFAALALAVAVVHSTIASIPCPTAAGAKTTAVQFESGSSSPDIAFDLDANHIFVGVRVNGSEPLAFMLDSGASTILGARCAERIGRATARTEVGSGVGEEPVSVSVAHDVTLSLPGVDVHEREVAVTDLSGVEAQLGRPVDGLLGASVFRSAVVTIDYDRRVLRLSDPKTFRYAGGGKAVSLVLGDELAFVRATVGPPERKPVAGLFEIDTGGGHGVILNSPFVAKHRLAPTTSDEAGAQESRVGGLGASAPVSIGHLDWIEIGGLRVPTPMTILSRAKSGMLSSDDFAGNIGGDILHHFRLTFDYSRGRLYFEQTARRQ